MTIFDYIVLIIIGLSVILSVMRGMIREVLAIVGLVAAFYVGVTYTNQLLPMMPIDIPNDALRVLAAFLVLFLATLLLATLLGIALSAIFIGLVESFLRRFIWGGPWSADCVCDRFSRRFDRYT